MDAAQGELNVGMAELRSGRLEQARARFLRALELAPDSPDAWHMLGAVELKSGRPAAAVEHFRQCLLHQPRRAEAHHGMAIALRESGRPRDAIAAFTAAMQSRPRYVDAAFNLGVGLEAIGDDAGAESTYRMVLEWRAEHVAALTRLGRLLCRLLRPHEGLPFLQAALRLAPESAPANGNLAVALIELGRHAEAAIWARKAVGLAPGVGVWWRTLGIAERLQRHNDRAIAALRKAIDLSPNDGLALTEFGIALLDSGQVAEARSALERVTPGPGDAERLRWSIGLSLPSVYADENEIDLERARFSRALEQIAGNLALDTPQQRSDAYDALSTAGTFLLHYQARDNTGLQFRFGDLAARVMAARAPQLARPCAWGMRSHGRRTRVGIVSSHLMHHTVSRYFRSLILGLDPSRFDVHVWHGGGARDSSTEQIERHVSQFVHTTEGPLELAARIRDTELDVVLYPEIGMDPRHHVLGALRLAPVQCMLYGHPVTSGLETIDYFLSGSSLEPEGADRHYREALVRLPGLGAKPEMPPPPGDGSWLDAYGNGKPLALCLQNPLKMPPAFDGVLTRFASRSGARIGFFFRRNTSVGRLFEARMENAFRRAGLDPAGLLVFLPTKSHASFLGAIRRAALVLDSPGFSGGATSLDAISVGTPVLTCEGEMARGRQTAAMLRIVGVAELIAADDDDYVEKAVRLYGDPALRNDLRDRIASHSATLFQDERPVQAFADFLESVQPR